METILLLALFFGPAVLASKGMGYRGAWFGFAALFLILSMGSCVGSLGMSLNVEEERAKEQREERAQQQRDRESLDDLYILSGKEPPPVDTDVSSRKQKDSWAARRSSRKQKVLNTAVGMSMWSSVAFLGCLLAGFFYRQKAS